MRHLLFALLLAVFAPAQAAEMPPAEPTAFEDPATGFRFPQRVSTYRFENRLEHASREAGYTIAYLENTGATADITVYTMGYTGIADGTRDSRVLAEFRKIDETLQRMVQNGQYKFAKRFDKTPLFKNWLQDNHEILLAGGRTLHAYSFMCAYDGRFIKVRVMGSPEGTYARLRPFLVGIMYAVGLMVPSPRSGGAMD